MHEAGDVEWGPFLLRPGWGWGNPCAAARAAASHLQAVPWVSPPPAQLWGLRAAQGVGTWGCVAAWDTRWRGSATCSAHRTGVAAGARDMLPRQDLLTCSEPPSLPAAFGHHPCRPAPSTSIPPLFLFEAACSTRTSSAPYDFCTAIAEPPGGSRVGGCTHSSMCMGRAHSLGDTLHLAEELACATLPQHARTHRQTGAPPGPQSCLHGSPGEGTRWVSQHHPAVPHRFPGQGDTAVSQQPRTLTQPSQLPVVLGWPDALAGAPRGTLAACPPCRAPLGTMVWAGSRDAARR